jgi:hypothetical protein
MPAVGDGHAIPKVRRREIFAALVAAEDQGLHPREARASVAQRFNIGAEQVLAIAAEGIAANWPPLD